MADIIRLEPIRRALAWEINGHPVPPDSPTLTQTEQHFVDACVARWRRRNTGDPR